MIKKETNIEKSTTFLHLNNEGHDTNQAVRRKPLTHKTGFNTQSAHTEFVEDKIAMEHGILPEFLYPLSI